MTPGRFACQDELIELFGLLVNVMFCMKRTDLTYVEVNAAFVRRTGRRSKRDVIGRTAADLFVPELAERYEEQDARVFATGEPLRDELELIAREDGTLGWYLTSKLPVAAVDAPDELAGLVSVSRDLAVPSDEAIAMESLRSVVDHVGAHLDATIRVADLCAVASCSPDQLERRMKRVFGVTATQYVLRARVDRAAALLTDTDLPLPDVAVRAGFYDQADLTRRFARLTSETPARFRAERR
ncbi:MAG: AraC family transcriptional regulator [Actinomycetota bacterium]